MRDCIRIPYPCEKNEYSEYTGKRRTRSRVGFRHRLHAGFRHRLCAVLLCVCLISGCGQKSAGPSQEEQPQGEVVRVGYTGMAGESPQLHYQVDTMYPLVLIDRIGYAAGGKKVAVFVGGENGAGYDIIDSGTGKTVYSGKMTYAGTEESRQAVCYGTFTEMVEEGAYFIRSDKLGESYPFVIGDGMYSELLRNICLSLERDWDGREAYDAALLMQDARTLTNLLIAYECYTGIFGDDTGCAYSGNTVPDLLDLAAVRIKKIASLDRSRLTDAQLAAYTGILAKFSQDYKVADASFSSECLAAAQLGYAALTKRESEDMDAALLFYAASELYRATGYAVYHDVIRSYRRDQGGSGSKDPGIMEFYGNIAYVTSKHRVDMKLCDGIVRSMMRDVEEIAASYNENLYMTMQEQMGEVCEDLVKLVVVNYVISSYEYVTVQENQLHYLLGRNPRGAGWAYRTADGIVTDNAEQASALVLLLCEIVKSEMGEGN